MIRFAPFGRPLGRTLRLLILACVGTLVTQAAQAATYVISFSGITDTNFYYDPYNDPAFTYYDTGPFTTTLSLTYPFEPYVQTDPDYVPPQPFDYYSNDPVLGSLHTFYFPDYYAGLGGYSSSVYTLGHRSISFSSGNGEGSSFNIGVTSPIDLFPTNAVPTPVDIDVTGSYISVGGYYKEPQYSYSAGRVTHLTISVIPGVPEPASWALMIVGFGAIGVACRRRPRAMPALPVRS